MVTRRTFTWIFLSCCVCFLTSVSLWVNYLKILSFEDRGVLTGDSLSSRNSGWHQWANVNTTNGKPPKVILLWNSLYHHVDHGFGMGHKPFLERDCPVSDCVVTTDKSHFHLADSVVFHLLHTYMASENFQFPERTHKKQIYVMSLFESPNMIYYNISMHKDRFNLTFTYLKKPETDIYAPYGQMVRNRNKKKYTPPSKEDLNLKTGMVAWLVSHCSAPSLRMEYAEELAKHIPVDIYGKCGNSSCPSRFERNKCFSHIETHYKFYLAFENSFCEDYVTEKTFRTLLYNTVPIVLGRADYKEILPDHSFIDVRDFRSPRHLAEFLRELAADDERYLEYYRWKRDLIPVGIKETRPGGFCKLCEILHNDSYPYKSSFDPAEYWSTEEWCPDAEHERQELHLYDL